MKSYPHSEFPRNAVLGQNTRGFQGRSGASFLGDKNFWEERTTIDARYATLFSATL